MKFIAVLLQSQTIYSLVLTNILTVLKLLHYKMGITKRRSGD